MSTEQIQKSGCIPDPGFYPNRIRYLTNDITKRSRGEKGSPKFMDGHPLPSPLCVSPEPENHCSARSPVLPVSHQHGSLWVQRSSLNDILFIRCILFIRMAIHYSLFKFPVNRSTFPGFHLYPTLNNPVDSFSSLTCTSTRLILSIEFAICAARPEMAS
jgi:hypothetical protein